MSNKIPSNAKWDDREQEISCYDDIVSLTENKRSKTRTTINSLQAGLIPYRLIDFAYTVNDRYFSNGKYQTVRNRNGIHLHIKGIKNNMEFMDKAPEFFALPMKEAYDRNYITAFLLFVNHVFIPWSRFRVIKSNQYLTLSIDGIRFDTKITDVQIVMIPTPISYSEDDFIEDDAKPLFKFDTEGLISKSGTTVIGIKHPKIKSHTIRDVVFDKYKLPVSNKKKLVSNNIIIFDTNGKLNMTDYNTAVEAGNLLTIKNSKGETFKCSIVCIWSELANESEDYITRFPNERLIRRLAAGEEIESFDTTNINLPLIRRDFDFNHSVENDYDVNINSSIDYIFGYDKNKYDKIFEEYSDLHCIEYSAEDLKKLRDSNNVITMSRDIYMKKDNHNETYVMLFYNGLFSELNKDLKYTIDTFSFELPVIEDIDILEVVYVQNVRNDLLSLELDHKTEQNYLKVSDYYIDKNDVLVYTSILGEHCLTPFAYNWNMSNMDSLDKESVKPFIDNTLYVGSQSQFAYKSTIFKRDTNIIYLDIKFRSCYNPDKYMLFINGRLVNRVFYKVLIPTFALQDKIRFKAIYTMQTIKAGDRVDIVYIGNNNAGNRKSYMNDLLIKATTTYATRDHQTTFVIPLPFKDYDLTNSDSVAVFKHGLYREKSKYYIYSENGVWYIEFLEEDDEDIVGEEVTFFFLYYSTRPYVSNVPTKNNASKYLSKSFDVTSPVTGIGIAGDPKFTPTTPILVFNGNTIMNHKEYSVPSDNNLKFTSPIDNTTITVVVQTDRMDIDENHIKLSSAVIKITEQAQNAIKLPGINVQDSYMIFRNGSLLNPRWYTVVDNILILNHDKNYNDVGDELVVFWCEDVSQTISSLNLYPITLTTLFDNRVDIPIFSDIDLSGKDNSIIFVNNKFISPTTYSITGNTVKFDSGIKGGSELVMYVAFKTLKPATTPFSLSSSIESGRFFFEERQVEVEADDQVKFKIPFPFNTTATPFLVMIRGQFISSNDYTLNTLGTEITLTDGRKQIKAGDRLAFIFIHNGNQETIQKIEKTVWINGETYTADIPNIINNKVDYTDRILVFYGSLYIDKKRYRIDPQNKKLYFNDIPYDDEDEKQLHIVMIYTESEATGMIRFIPESGFLTLDENSLDRNMTKETYMLFINGKKIAKSQIIDITNYLKKIKVDIKTRFGMELFSFAPLINELKNRYTEARKRSSKSFVGGTKHKVRVRRSANQMVGVRYNGELKTTSFDAEEGSVIETVVKPNDGYFAGTPNISATVVDSPIEISASEAIKGIPTKVTIEQTPYQKIFVRCNGKTYTESFSELPSYRYTVSIKSTDQRYDVGVLNSYGGTIRNEEIIISASEAVRKQVSVSILDRNLEHQSFEAVVYNDTMDTILETITEPGEYKVPCGSYIQFNTKPNRGYKSNGLDVYGNVGALEVLDETNVFSFAKPDDPVTYTVTIPRTYNQKVIVGTKYKYDTKFEYHDSTFTALYGDIFDIKVEPDKRYTGGRIYNNYDNASVGILTKNLEIQVDNAELISNTYMINIDSDPNTEIYMELDDGTKLYPGTTHQVIEGTSYEVKTIPNDYFIEPIMSSYKGTIHSNIRIKVEIPAKPFGPEKYTKMVRISLDPKPGTSITAYNRTNGRTYKESFYCNLNDELVFSTECDNKNLYSYLSIPENTTIITKSYYIITNSYPVPKSQKDYTSYLNQEKDKKVSIEIDNAFETTQLVKISYDGKEVTNTSLKDIPIGTKVTFELISPTIVGRLFINGIRINSNKVTIPVGSYGKDILTQSTKLVVSCSAGNRDQDNKHTCSIRLMDKEFKHQSIHVEHWNNGKKIEDISLPSIINVSELTALDEYRVYSLGEEGYLPNKTNYTVIRPIEDAVYLLDCGEATKMEVE